MSLSNFFKTAFTTVSSSGSTVVAEEAATVLTTGTQVLPSFEGEIGSVQSGYYVGDEVRVKNEYYLLSTAYVAGDVLEIVIPQGGLSQLSFRLDEHIYSVQNSSENTFVSKYVFQLPEDIVGGSPVEIILPKNILFTCKIWRPMSKEQKLPPESIVEMYSAFVQACRQTLEFQKRGDGDMKGSVTFWEDKAPTGIHLLYGDREVELCYDRWGKLLDCRYGKKDNGSEKYSLRGEELFANDKIVRNNSEYGKVGWLIFSPTSKLPLLEWITGEPKQSIVSENAPCGCGSGKKYKYCHGKKS